MIFISEETGISDFRDQEIPEGFTKCDPNNIWTTITCGVFENADSPDSLIQKAQHVIEESSLFRSCHFSYL